MSIYIQLSQLQAKNLNVEFLLYTIVISRIQGILMERKKLFKPTFVLERT